MGCNAWNHSPDCNCGWGGVFAPCQGGVEMACYHPLPAAPGGAVPDDLWQALCKLSQSPFVSRIVSGSI